MSALPPLQLVADQPRFTTIPAPEKPPRIPILRVPGPQGRPGRDGSGGDGRPSPQTFALTGAASWSRAHGFGYLPTVLVTTPTGVLVEVDVVYPDPEHVALAFPSPFTGTVTLS